MLSINSLPTFLLARYPGTASSNENLSISDATFCWALCGVIKCFFENGAEFLGFLDTPWSKMTLARIMLQRSFGLYFRGYLKLGPAVWKSVSFSHTFQWYDLFYHKLSFCWSIGLIILQPPPGGVAIDVFLSAGFGLFSFNFILGTLLHTCFILSFNYPVTSWAVEFSLSIIMLALENIDGGFNIAYYGVNFIAWPTFSGLIRSSSNLEFDNIWSISCLELDTEYLSLYHHMICMSGLWACLCQGLFH